jgi:hypothetical protein
VITRTSRRYLARVNSEPVSAVTGRLGEPVVQTKRPAQGAGTGRTRRRPARGEVEPMPGWCEQARGIRVSIGTGVTHGTRAAHGKRVDPALEVASGRAGASYRGTGGPRGQGGEQTGGGGPWGRLAGWQCGITYSGVWAMRHCLHSGLGRPGLLGRPTAGVTAVGGKLGCLRWSQRQPWPVGLWSTGDCLAGVLPAEGLVRGGGRPYADRRAGCIWPARDLGLAGPAAGVPARSLQLGGG